MQLINYLKEQMPFMSISAAMLILTSCGSSQYVGQDYDGIYDSNEDANETEVVQTNNNSYYQNYFKEKSSEYDYITEEEEVFTDIDAYEGTYAEQNAAQQESYAGWGQENENVTINVYSGFNSGFYGYNNWYRPYGFGFGFGYGYGSPYWNIGWGYSGFYDPFWCPPYAYGGYYGYPYYRHYRNRGYYGNYYNRNSMAYHDSRRGRNLNRYHAVNRRNTVAPRSYNNVTRPRVNTTRPRTTTTKPRTTTRPRVNTTRPRTTTKPRTTTRPRTQYNTPRSSSPRSYSTPRSYTPRSSGTSSGSRGSSMTRTRRPR